MPIATPSLPTVEAPSSLLLPTVEACGSGPSLQHMLEEGGGLLINNKLITYKLITYKLITDKLITTIYKLITNQMITKK